MAKSRPQARPAKRAVPAKATAKARPAAKPAPAKAARKAVPAKAAKLAKPGHKAGKPAPARQANARSAKQASPAAHKAVPAKLAKASAKAKAKAKQASAKPAKQPAKAKQANAKQARPAKQPTRRGRRASTSQLSLPGFTEPAGAGDADDGSSGAADRATQIASLAVARARDVDPAAPVRLGTITVPSGTLAIFDIALIGYLPRPALDPMLICAEVPTDRALAVIGTRVGKGRFADCWDHVAIELAAGDVARSRKLGSAAVDFARLICMDRAAIDHWQHEDSLDQLADFLFTGRDEAALAKTLGARRLPGGVGHGWLDLPVAEAEVKADRAAALKAEHGWQITSELRPHSHHAAIVAAAHASSSGAGVIELAGARVLLFFTSWGNGVFPVYLDVDRDNRAVRIRIQLAAADAPPPARA